MTQLFNLSFLNSFKRRAFLALLLVFTTACSSTTPFWIREDAIGTTGSYNSARLYLPPANEYTGLELELVNMREGLRMYINVFGLEIPPDKNDPSISHVFISFKDHSYCFSAQRFLGGQRLLIPETVQSEMIDYLQEGLPVFIKVGRYEADIYPDKFNIPFNHLMAAQLATKGL